MKTVDEYWAGFFGVAVSELLSAEPKIVPHAGLQNYQGVWLFRRDPKVVISAPPNLVAVLESHPSRCFTDEELIDLLGNKVDRVIGPAFQGFLTQAEFRPRASEARLLTKQDEESLHKLQAACDEEQWEHSDIEIGCEPIWGCYADGLLVAAATYRTEAGAAFSGLITHPQFRRRGFGKAVLSQATEHGLNSNLLMLYQTLVANKPAMAAAQSLGYKLYAMHLAIRLRSDDER